MAKERAMTYFVKKSWILYVLGFFFIASGLGKSIEMPPFVNLVQSLLGKSVWAGMAALVVPPVEVAIGLALAFHIYPRYSSAGALVLLTVFTGAFAYNYFIHGVEDCGCFGALEIFKTSPLISFIRNFSLMALAVLSVRYPLSHESALWKYFLVLLLTSASAMGVGLTAPRHLFRGESPWLGQEVNLTPLNALVKTHTDSTYLVFLFSYQCSHCWDATENIKSFLRTRTVDKVLAFGIGTAEQRKIFEQMFEPDFSITTIQDWQLLRPVLGGSGGVPQMYIIRQNKVIYWTMGEVESPMTWRLGQSAKTP
jgi:Methylamine utilisation protein MauE